MPDAIPETLPERNRHCPKHMRFGPCGGVSPPDHCEVPGVRCPFVHAEGPIRWPVPASGRLVRPRVIPRVLVDFRPDPTLEWEVAESAEVLRSAGAGVLIGDHLDDPTPHRPAAVAATVAEHGLRATVTLTCRSRTLSELTHQLETLAEIDVVAVHCVTGDHPAARLGLDGETPFALDSFELVALAQGLGVPTSVAESPTAAPRAWRPSRLRSKQDAGAEMAVLNHGGSPAEMVAFADACRARGVTIPLVAPVPVITDRRSADALRRFPGLQLPSGLTEEILEAADPDDAGRRVATRLAGELLGSGRFAAVNLSGSASSAGLVDRARIMADIADRLRP